MNPKFEKKLQNITVPETFEETFAELTETVSAGTQIRNTDEIETDVLFQKLCGRWYAFSVVNDECLYTRVSANEVRKRLNQRKIRS